MKQITLFLIFILSIFLYNDGQAQEWRKFYKSVNLDKYRPDNEKLGPPAEGESRVVLMGNSITEVWPVSRPDFFERTGYIGRGISGHTTPQMLIRYRTDVISLQPKVVAILAGVNDIAQNTGYTPIEIIAENVMTMAELAKQHGTEVVICSVLPAIDFPWKPGLEPARKIIELNAILKDYADKNELIYVDYHTALKDENNGLKVPEYTTENDLVHPNANGYAVMEPMLEKAVNLALTTNYGKNRVTPGPLYKSNSIKGKKILLEFDNMGSGLAPNDSELIGFEIAGTDKKYVSATAEIIVDKIQVYAKSIRQPKYVRYAWNDKGIGNLKNKEGLPASSFTTED